MVDRILAGKIGDEDIAAARAYSYGERKKLVERLLGALVDKLGETVMLNDVLEDVGNALKQARPVFAAGMPVDQALGFIVKLVQDSLDDLEEAGAADTDEYEKQETVLEMLNGFIDACNTSGNTQGEQALEAARFEYRGEVGKLEALRNECELCIGNSIAFLQQAYGEGSELDAFVKGLDHNMTAARYIGIFGSPSFFMCKHVAKPGETYHADTDDAEED